MHNCEYKVQSHECISNKCDKGHKYDWQPERGEGGEEGRGRVEGELGRVEGRGEPWRGEGEGGRVGRSL